MNDLLFGIWRLFTTPVFGALFALVYALIIPYLPFYISAIIIEQVNRDNTPMRRRIKIIRIAWYISSIPAFMSLFIFTFSPGYLFWLDSIILDFNPVLILVYALITCGLGVISWAVAKRFIKSCKILPMDLCGKWNVVENFRATGESIIFTASKNDYNCGMFTRITRDGEETSGNYTVEVRKDVFSFSYSYKIMLGCEDFLIDFMKPHEFGAIVGNGKPRVAYRAEDAPLTKYEKHIKKSGGTI
ncbi:MAG: hypothetical protein FWC95_05150 [Defluviitaleaceae bacterium]|nr:hypothetical protein [Defluviitaleaceae bacterium]